MATEWAPPIRLRWHGRGGQGVVTASRIAAEAALQAGLYPQSLPDFGAERSGAPIAAHTRIDRRPPVERGPITDPTIVIVLDASLIGPVDVASGLVDGGRVLVNTPKRSEELTASLGLPPAQIHTLDASSIGRRLLGRNLPNVPMLGALIKVVPFVPLASIEDAARSVLSASLKESVVESNITALREGHAAVSVVMAVNHDR